MQPVAGFRPATTTYDFPTFLSIGLVNSLSVFTRQNGATHNGPGHNGPVHIMTNPNRGRGGVPTPQSENGTTNGHAAAPAMRANGYNAAVRGRGGPPTRGIGFNDQRGAYHSGAPRGTIPFRGRGFTLGDRGGPRGGFRGRGRGMYANEAPS